MHAAGGRRLPRTKIQAAQFLQILYDLRLAPLAMDDLGSAAAQRRGDRQKTVDAEHGRKSAKRAEQSQLFRVDVVGQAGAPASSNEKMSMPEILDLMIRRGYYSQFIEKKRDSAGPGRPPKMSLEDCKRWASFFYLQKLKRYERQQPVEALASKSCTTTSEPAREDLIRAPQVAENAHTGKVEELPTEDREVANSKRRRGRGLGDLGPRLRALLHADKTRDPAPLVGVIKKKQHSRRYRKRPNEQPRSMF
eukprot:g2129.t1